MNITEISFPGMGIDQFEVNNMAFDLADVAAVFGIEMKSLPIYWYGIIITCGVITAFLYAVFRGNFEKVNFDNCVDMALWTIICGVVGARLYYVLTSMDQFLPNPFNLWEFLGNVVNLRGGGLAIYGGIIGGATALALSAYIKKINPIKVLDMAGPGVMIAQAIGRWGNFFNGEAFGGIVAEGHPLYFMRMGLVSVNSISDFGTTGMVFVHPTFLYESLWNICGFILINLFYKKKKFNGQIACMYLAWYGFGRMFIEGLRTDSLYIPGTEIRISQLVGLICFVVFGGLLIAGLIYSKKLAEKSEYNAFEKLLIPDLVMNPVFFEKKANKTGKNGNKETKEQEKTAEKTDNSGENPAEATEDKNGENN